VIVVKSISNFFFNRPVDLPEPVSDEQPALLNSHDVVELPVDQIAINPFQPRKTFSEDGLAELSASIREFGIIQPLVLRRTEQGNELIAGERRLRAARLAGLAAVPCVFRQATDKEMAEIALIENLQREDLHFFEESAGYEKLLTQFELTQEELAHRVGKNQSTIANKLRLLKLSPEVRDYIFQTHLTERHSRALLKIEDESVQMQILHSVVDNKLNVRDTELFIEQVLLPPTPEAQPVKKQSMMKVIKDVRIFINTVGELVKQMKKIGLDVKLTQAQDEETVTLTMIVPKRR
jgi:ParB family transcriptional regulator, chromosome partitioning protein